MDTILKILFWLLLCQPLWAGPAFVQSATQTGTTSTLTVTLGSTPVNGNILVCGATNNNNNVSSITGGGGGTWTQLIHHGTVVVADVWASQLVSGGSTTITVTYAAAGNPGAAICAEFSGVTTTTDGTATGNSATSTQPSAGTITTTSGNGDLVLSVFMQNAGNTISSGPTNSYVELGGASGLASGATVSGFGYLIQGTAGATSTTWTMSGSAGWDSSIAALAASAAAASASRMTLLHVGP